MAALEKLDFILAGVGGQGTILLGELICEAGMAVGYDVKKSDVLGMSQRGGNVVTYIRFGEKVHAPLPKKGEVDFLVSLEVLEASRWASHLRPGGIAIVNDHRILPLSVSSGNETYPANGMVEALLRRRTDRVLFVEGTTIASELKNPRVLNVVVLGYMSSLLPIETEVWREVIKARVPARVIDLNLSAFEKGRAAAMDSMRELVK